MVRKGFMAMKRRYLWIVIIDLLMCGFWFLCLNHSTMYYCGQLDKKPSLAFGLSPTWFDNNFQINIGNKEIISNRIYTEPFFDDGVKGSELFKTLLAYDVSRNDAGVLFKALNWEGAEQVFLLRKYSPLDKEEYAYEVTVQENIDTDPKWVSVGKFSCLVGGYRTLIYSFLVLVVIINITILLKLLFRALKNNK